MFSSLAFQFFDNSESKDMSDIPHIVMTDRPCILCLLSTEQFVTLKLAEERPAADM